jgi:hypothetical protein
VILEWVSEQKPMGSVPYADAVLEVRVPQGDFLCVEMVNDGNG